VAVLGSHDSVRQGVGPVPIPLALEGFAAESAALGIVLADVALGVAGEVVRRRAEAGEGM
jgi:hypothetical protein